jgi:hypothetical protein
MVEPVVVIVPHRLGKQSAKARLRDGLQQIRSKLALVGAASLDETWAGDEMRFHVAALGQTVTGHIEVLETSARVEVYLPGMLGWLGRRLADRVRREGSLLLDKK